MSKITINIVVECYRVYKVNEYSNLILIATHSGK